MNQPITTRVLCPSDLQVLRSVMQVFAAAFADQDTYLGKPPSDAYLSTLLSSDTFVAIAASMEGQVVGGLTGYTLRKCEQERSEFYIYDLAVCEGQRRRGVATALINALQSLAAERGIYVIFVQADHGDDPAVALYTKLGTREDVMHFDILPPQRAARAASPSSPWGPEPPLTPG